MKERCYKDNLIIALSVILVIAVIGGCVAGVVFGLGGDVKAGVEVAEAYVYAPNPGGGYPIELQSLTFDLSEPITFDFVPDASITSFDVSFYSVFDDFVDVYNSTYGTDYTSAVSSGHGDFDRFVPICFVIPANTMTYTGITTSTSFRYTLNQYSQPLTTSTTIFDIRVANETKLFTTSMTCYGGMLSIPISWNNTYPGAGVLGTLSITRLTIYYITANFAYGYGIDMGYDNGYEHGAEVGYELGLDEGFDNGFTEGRFKGRYEGYEIGKEEGYDNGYDAGKQVGYYEGIESAGDYSWYSLLSAVFDAPLRIMIGDWQQINGEWQLVGGMLNFEIPGLDINFAPVLTSLFTLVILIVLLRFIFSFIG